MVSAGLGLVAAPATGAAQVLSIDGDGKVTVFDGPAVYTDAGVSQIASARTSLRKPARVPLTRDVSQSALDRAAHEAALSPALVDAVAWRESRLREGAVSPMGALGAMQLMPATARGLRVDPRDPDQNLQGGASYLAGLMRRYDGNLVLALSAYNAGPAAVARYRGMPPYKETQAYVAAVLDRLSQLVVPVDAIGSARR